MAQRLAQGLKTHKRKDALTSESVKKARTEGIVGTRSRVSWLDLEKEG